MVVLMATIEEMKSSYDEFKNLKVAAEHLKMKWQTLYWNLKKVNHPIIGDKLSYGSNTDKFAAKAENDFAKMIPFAKNLNSKKFQSKVDFYVNGLKIDVKASNAVFPSAKSASKRWAFSIKKQEFCADFIVCFGYINGEINKILLLPSEVIRYRTTISLSCSNKKSKWEDYLISKEDLIDFFTNTIH